MNESLFPSLPPSPSPRLAWIQKHGLELHDFGENVADNFGAGARWLCSSDDPRAIGTGETADEALADWAKAKGVKLWNE